MLVAWVFTELSGIALATTIRFVFLDSVPCNWSSLTCATSRMTKSQSWNEPERKMQPGMHSSHVSFIRVAGKIPTNTWHRWKIRRRNRVYISFDSMERRTITCARIIWSKWKKLDRKISWKFIQIIGKRKLKISNSESTYYTGTIIYKILEMKTYCMRNIIDLGISGEIDELSDEYF